MSVRLIDLMLRLAPRERWILALLVLVVLPVGIVFGLLVPLQEARHTALIERTEAVALNLWVQDRVVDLHALEQSLETGPRQTIGTSGIEQDLIAAGLRNAIAELSNDSDGVISLRFDDVSFTRLADWLSASDPGWGYDITQFRFEATDTPGNAAAALILTPRQN